MFLPPSPDALWVRSFGAAASRSRCAVHGNPMLSPGCRINRSISTWSFAMLGMRNVLVLALGLGVISLSAAQQLQSTQSSQPAPQATFRTTTSLVEVDVVIHDKKGDFVGGLKADDLQLFEDGKAQKIEQFYMVSHERGGQLIPVTGDQEVAPEDRARRIFVVMFDEGHLNHESLMRSKQGVIKF